MKATVPRIKPEVAAIRRQSVLIRLLYCVSVKAIVLFAVLFMLIHVIGILCVQCTVGVVKS